MQSSSQVTGVIDIGSNTVRLAVFQLQDNGAFRVIDQGRWPARLSQKLGADGRLPVETVAELGEVLRHFRRICRMHGADRVRAVATAAIRQAANRHQVLQTLYEETGLEIELLSGEDEARLGSAAVMRTMDLQDAFVVDIGGGSTEITLLRGREIVAAVSYPIGCVNTASRFGLSGGPLSPSALEAMMSDIRDKLLRSEWLSRHPGLPLVGLGGTVRALAKLRQRTDEYPYAHLHGYELSTRVVDASLELLSAMPLDKRRKFPGLSKDRADVIVPGLAILSSVARASKSSRLVVCGAGLRDGLFYETCLPLPETPGAHQVLEESIRNLTALYPGATEGHLNQIRRLALALFDRLAPGAGIPASVRRLLDAAARLCRIGAVIDFNDSADHTFYMLMHAHWNGLSHREKLLTAAIASYRGPIPLRRKLTPYRSLLREGDLETVVRLGSLLQLAAALDRSEAQAIDALDVSVAKGNRLRLEASANHPLPMERMEVDALAKLFKKSWGLTPSLKVR
ncbi:Ppx/GppA phosphatase family protein [Cohnella sp. REN36]|uniref:Ppx/GppA phosphatase family protein n=1 Tax=Cohnella sp. REN36 TaxID=2887347 RepID=UPI001D154912|nr:Ppx/GppA family phosphatase [Cohnella sp. REN36]